MSPQKHPGGRAPDRESNPPAVHPIFWRQSIGETGRNMGNILHVEEGGWGAIESSSKPVLVDFWAEWCGPCRMLAPTIDKLAEAYEERVSFAKVNVDELPDLANRFGVRSIPTLALFREGKVVERLVGLKSYDELARLLDREVGAQTKL